MIRPFLYDVKRTLTSKTVIILIAIVVLISLAIIPLTGISNGISRFGAQPNILYYYDNGSYNFIDWVHDSYGDPLNGIRVTITLTGNQNYTGSGSSDNTGLIYISIAAPLQPSAQVGNYRITIADSTNGASSSSIGTYLNPPPSLGQAAILTGTAFSSVQDKHNSSIANLEVFFAAPHGKVPTGYSVYYRIDTPRTNPPSKYPPYNKTEMRFLGNMTTEYHALMNPIIPNGTDPGSTVWTELFAPNNSTAIQTSQFSIFDLRQQRGPIDVNNIATVFFTSIIGFFVPLVVIIGSYSSYGKDRLTGVMESILSTPVTRRGLAISRFSSTILAFTIAVAGSIGIVDVLLNRIGGSSLGQDYILAILGGLVVEIVAFTGLIFLVSHLVKSTGLLLGIGIGLFVVLDFFWGIIIFAITLALGGTSGSFTSQQAAYLSFYANPAQFLNLINFYVFQASTGTAANYGVTLPGIVIAGLLWAIVPFILFLYLAMKRD